MAYIYESIQNGIFRFTIPGENKTVTLFKGSKVLVQQKLSGSYLRVLKLVEEVNNETVNKSTKPKAKVEDKITKVEEVVEVPAEEIEVKVEDKIIEKEEETSNDEQTTPKRRGRRKK